MGDIDWSYVGDYVASEFDDAGNYLEEIAEDWNSHVADKTDKAHDDYDAAKRAASDKVTEEIDFTKNLITDAETGITFAATGKTKELEGIYKSSLADLYDEWDKLYAEGSADYAEVVDKVTEGNTNLITELEAAAAAAKDNLINWYEEQMSKIDLGLGEAFKWLGLRLESLLEIPAAVLVNMLFDYIFPEE